MLRRYQNAVLLCPPAVTGGPEAIHQLSQFLNDLGLRSEIAFYGDDATIAIKNNRLVCKPPSQNPCLAAYSKYNPVVCFDAPLDHETIVILPEVLAGDVDRFGSASVAVWWLSVDNAFLSKRGLATDDLRTTFFQNKRILHFCQSFYARELLRQNGTDLIYDLVDYTDDLFTSLRPKKANLGSALAYNPRKGRELSKHFFNENHEFQGREIQNMNKRQIYEVFSKTRIYVEFGHNPGKDRMPREAASAGCIVVARRKGGTAFFGDSPIADEFKFDDEDVATGSLSQLLRRIMQNPDFYWESQSFYRNYLYTERELMRLQVKRIFGI